MATGFQAARLSLAGFLIPFVFVYHPAVLYKLQILFLWFGDELPNSNAMVDSASIGWGAFFWIIFAFSLAIWLLTSALSGFEKNKLTKIEIAARAAIGLLVLHPNITIAGLAIATGVSLIIIHRFLGGDPSPIDTAH